MEFYETLISVIIPCYNAENFLSEALESLIMQTYSNWECIIVDDNSEDNSAEIAIAYSNKYPGKVYFYTNTGKGACKARNYGISLSKGSYLKFLDSDDALFDKHVLETQVQILSSDNYDIVYGEEFYFKNKFEEGTFIKKRGEIITNKLESFYKNFPITSSFMVKKSRLKTLRWNENLKSGQEFFLLFQCYLNRLLFKFEATPVCKIRVHDSIYRISNKPKTEYAFQIYELFKEMYNELVSNKVSDEELQEFKKQLLVHSYYSIRFRNYKSLKMMQMLLKKMRGVKVRGLAARSIFYFNYISPFVGFALYKVLTIRGGKIE